MKIRFLSGEEGQTFAEKGGTREFLRRQQMIFAAADVVKKSTQTPPEGRMVEAARLWCGHGQCPLAARPDARRFAKS